ncbi:cysteine hydrolase family protein [Shewanella sp. NIFS-20-20]|uniref:cysteine hydrolase family protein n=1 Tax=Shewanella sp. NIFS-20-20 TaxID=2853806 RepID=UPI001C43B6C6|nr:isochorismatase family cysteine hydrolase [Shewanella sp. NIFS-20-20]MBV7316291.1 cysteine hydrolase [Shewanella sp. NIFS-20-20]
MSNSRHPGLVVIDLINEMVDPNGKMSAAFCQFEQQHQTLNKVANLLHFAREHQWTIIHVRVGFSDDYHEVSGHSPLFANAATHGALKLSSWGCEFHPKVAPVLGESIICKHRVSAFYQTNLELLLRVAGVSDLYLAGVSTQMTIQTTSREAHDRDFKVHVVSDGCISANDQEQQQNLPSLGRIAKLIQVDAIISQQRDH